MPRPLYIYKSVVEEDSSITREKISSLLGETVNISDKAHQCLAQCIRLLTKRDRANTNTVDIHTVDLGVRLWNDLKTTSELAKNGFYLQAVMVARDAIEIRAIAEYLHSFPNEAEAWWKAKTIKERRRFGINAIKENIEGGQTWKDLWDRLSSYVHPNSKAVPLYGADKAYYGHHLFLGGFYYPGNVEFIYILQLSICIGFMERMIYWYKNEPEFTNELSKDIDLLRNEYHMQVNYLKERVESEKKKTVDKVLSTRLSKAEVIEAFKFLDNLS